MMKHDAPIGIIAAMQLEAEGILSSMTDITTETISGIVFSAGRLAGRPLVVAVCGIGKVFAALCAQTMILRYQPSLILNTGVAGSLSSALSIGDIAVATALVQHDMDTSPLGDPVGWLSGIGLVKLPCEKEASDRLADCVRSLGIGCCRGVIASGDVFVSDAGKKRWIASTFDAVACEMEGASIGQVCYVNGTPCAVMRAISDGGDDSAHLDFPAFARLAADNAVRVILTFFESM